MTLVSFYFFYKAKLNHKEFLVFLIFLIFLPVSSLTLIRYLISSENCDRSKQLNINIPMDFFKKLKFNQHKAK